MANLRNIEKGLRAKGITNVEVTKDKNIFYVLHILKNGIPVPLFKTDNKDELNKYLTVNYGIVEDKKGKGWRENPDASGKAPVHKAVATRAQAKHAQNKPMKKTPTYKPPYRVDVWEERDRLIITVYDKNDIEIASWVDDDAREMFVDGFFDSRDLEQSVLKYLEHNKIIKGGT